MQLLDIFKASFERIIEKSYSYRVIKKQPSEWVEENVFLTSAESVRTGLFSYNFSPYSKEVIDNISPSNPAEVVAIMKCSQSGFTSGVIVPAMAYIMDESPANILFLSGNETLVKDTMRDRFDTVINNNSRLKDLIRPNVVKKKNQKSGDTDSKKEFAGGSLTAISYNPSKLRFYSVKYILADEFDDAPRNDKKEGSIRSLVEARAKSFGSRKKIIYCSSPTVKGQSNIEEAFNLGDKRKWNWECPHCKTYIPIEWRIDKGDGNFAGIKYQLNEKKELIEDSVHYECQECEGKIYYKQKYDLNLTGKWIPTCKPTRPNYLSYKFNALCNPPGFSSWIDLVYKWLDANPPDGVIDEGKLKTFINVELGDLWEEKGTTLRVNELMDNTRSYNIGVVPDTTIENDDNGKVSIITMACDLGGIMNEDIEDVRLDYEIIAHSTKGRTYSIDHGSIGTFKRTRERSKREKENDSNREKWTYREGLNNCVWDKLREIMDTNFIGQSGNAYNIDLTVIDTGEFTKLANNFIDSIQDKLVVGVKGYGEEERKASKDTPVINRSREQRNLYILQVNQLKDILASNMKLKRGIDGFQPSGFMNFPQPENGKYTMRSYFSHFEGEHRVPVIKNDVEVGFAWKKKHSHVKNHFFDVAVYNIAAKDIYIDYLRRNFKEYRDLTWDDFCLFMEQ